MITLEQPEKQNTHSYSWLALVGIFVGAISLTLVLGFFGYLILFTLLGLLTYHKSGFMRMPYGLKKSNVVDVVLLSVIVALAIDYVQASPSKLLTDRDKEKREHKKEKKAQGEDVSPRKLLSEDETDSGNAGKDSEPDLASKKHAINLFTKKSGEALGHVKKSSVNTYQRSNRVVLRQKLKQTIVRTKKTTRRMEGSSYKTQQTRTISGSQPSRAKPSMEVGQGQKKPPGISINKSTNYSKPPQVKRNYGGAVNNKSSSASAGSKKFKAKSAPPGETGKKRKPEAPSKSSVYKELDNKKRDKPEKPDKPKKRP